MEFQRVVERRRMVRRFRDEPVPREVLDRVLANGVRAPSAGFSQGWAFVVLEGEDRRVFWETTRTETWDPASETVHAAGALILPLAHKQAYLDRYRLPDKAHTPLSREQEWPVPYWEIDVAFACQNMLLTVVDAGLGALFFGIFHGEYELLERLGVPSGYRPIGAIAVGTPVPGERSHPLLRTGRRPASEVVHRGRWRGGSR